MAININRRVLELYPLALHSGNHRICIQVEDIFHKFVVMTRFHSVESECVRWKAPLIEGHEYAGTKAG